MIEIVPADMAFAPGGRKSDLFLPFAKPLFVKFGCVGRALMARYAMFEFGAVAIGGQYRSAARMA